jgi:hypothetical protein
MYEDVEIEDGPTSKFQHLMARKWQHYLDLSAPHIAPRWCLSASIMLIYSLRVYLINGAHSRAAPPLANHDPNAFALRWL